MPSFSHIKQVIRNSNLDQALKQALEDLAKAVDSNDSDISDLESKVSSLESKAR